MTVGSWIWSRCDSEVAPCSAFRNAWSSVRMGAMVVLTHMHSATCFFCMERGPALLEKGTTLLSQTTPGIHGKVIIPHPGFTASSWDESTPPPYPRGSLDLPPASPPSLLAATNSHGCPPPPHRPGRLAFLVLGRPAFHAMPPYGGPPRRSALPPQLLFSAVVASYYLA